MKIKSQHLVPLPPLTVEQQDALRASIEAEGLRVPIDVDEQGNILDGEHRFDIVGQTDLVRVVSGLSEAEKRAYAFQSNLARRNMSPAQWREIQPHLKEIALALAEEGSTQEEIGRRLGVAQNTVSAWFGTPIIGPDNRRTRPDARVKIPREEHDSIVERLEEGETQEQVAADYGVGQQAISQIATKAKDTKKRKEARPKKGMYDHVTLLHGNMEDLVDGKFDLVVTDPPYLIDANYDSVVELEWDRSENPLKQIRSWLSVIQPHLSDEYNLFWFCSPSMAADTELVFRELELSVQSRIVWPKRSLPKGRKGSDRFLSTWDMILHAGNRPLNFPKEWTDAWFDVQLRQDEDGNLSCFEIPLTTSKKEPRVHETQKPEELMRRLVEFGSYPGDRILDPFAGGGTTGVVTPTDREVVLIEKETKYVRAIEKRLSIRRGS